MNVSDRGAVLGLPSVIRLSAILIALVPLLLSGAVVVAGNALFGTLLAVRLDLDGVAVTEIGLILTCYSLGWVAGALAGPPLINRAGHIRAVAALAAAAALIHPLSADEWLWAGLLLCFGIGAALGPILSSQVMAALGPAGLFHSSVAVAAALALVTLYRMARRPTVPNAAQVGYVAVLNTTGEAAYLDPRAEPADEQWVFDFDGEAGRP